MRSLKTERAPALLLALFSGAFITLASHSALAQRTSVEPGGAGADVMATWDSIKPAPPPALKRVKLDPATTALVMMDFDKRSCTPEKRARCAAMLPGIEALLARAREKQMIVVHFYMPT